LIGGAGASPRLEFQAGVSARRKLGNEDDFEHKEEEVTEKK